MNETVIQIPASVRAEIERQAGVQPQALLPEDRDGLLAIVGPEHEVSVEQALNDRAEVQERAIRDWRDQVLLRILTVAESLINKGVGVESNAPKRTDVDEWLETEQVAVYLNLTPKTVREGAARGTLPGCKYPPRSIRGKWRFKKDDLDKFLKRRQPPARQQAIERSVWE